MAVKTQTRPTVGAVMHSPLVTVGAADSLWTAVDVMLTTGLRHVVVTHGDTALGVLADKELAAVWATSPLGLKRRHAADVLPAKPPFVSADADVVAAACRMRSQGLEALVVVDDRSRPLGIVTDHDLLGVLAGLCEDLEPGVEPGVETAVEPGVERGVASTADAAADRAPVPAAPSAQGGTP
ncbi:CBS domain-containing protein [Yinghuangia seranimata]|uniref:CBS domain-containing protein n=1 Tax=Yinghuangia seranimata TaxID=408067 RepID=UPI00248B7DF3|nr:CBS domain-containing protein [Yinghuangia seranimata]MDI2125439.1 CBS domain-containing protein [Yinghuangia seranimata]